MNKASLVLVTACQLLSPSIAAEHSFITEGDLLGDVQLISAATHLEQTPSTAPAAVTVIDRRMIEAMPAVSVTDLFRMVPGFQSYLVNSGNAAVNYHVLADEYPRRMEIKVDGRSVYDSMFMTVVWSTLGLELDDIERIEIVRGSGAPAHGSNAFLGSINIVTRSPVTDGGLTLRSWLGSDDIRYGSAAFAGQAGQFSHRTTLRYRSDAGFNDVEEEGMYDASRSKNLRFRAIWTPSSTGSLDFELGMADDQAGIGGDNDFTYRHYKYNYQKLHWNYQLGGGDQLEWITYHNDLNLDDRHAYIFFADVLGDAFGLDGPMPEPFPGPFSGWPNLPVQIGFDGAESERWDSELRVNSTLGDHLRLAVGVAVRRDQVRSSLLFDSDGEIERTYYRSYGNIEWRASNSWVYNGGLMVEKAEGHDHYVSARLGSNYLIDKNHTLRLVASHGERLPTILESAQRMNMRYNQDIVLDAVLHAADQQDNETLDSWELGYNGRFDDGRVNMDVRLFSERYRDMLRVDKRSYSAELNPDQRIGIRDNIYFADFRGVELEFSYRPDARLLLSASYTNNHLYSWRNTSPRGRKDYRDRTPRHSASLLLGYQFDHGVAVSASVAHQGRTDWYDGNNAAGYSRVDLKVNKRWQFGRSEAEVSLLAQNAVGPDYTEFYDTNVFTTRYILGVQVKLP